MLKTLSIPVLLSATLSAHTPAAHAAPPLEAVFPVACSLAFPEIAVGPNGDGSVTQAWLVVVNRTALPQPVRYTTYMDDGTVSESTGQLRPGRNSFPLHQAFKSGTIVVFSLAVDLPTTQAFAGVTHRLSAAPWHVYDIASASCAPAVPTP